MGLADEFMYPVKGDHPTHRGMDKIVRLDRFALKNVMNRFAWAADAMNLQPNDNVLEIGCGVGLAIPELLQHLLPGAWLPSTRQHP